MYEHTKSVFFFYFCFERVYVFYGRVHSCNNPPTIVLEIFTSSTFKPHLIHHFSTVPHRLPEYLRRFSLPLSALRFSDFHSWSEQKFSKRKTSRFQLTFSFFSFFFKEIFSFIQTVYFSFLLNFISFQHLFFFCCFSLFSFCIHLSFFLGALSISSIFFPFLPQFSGSFFYFFFLLYLTFHIPSTFPPKKLFRFHFF